MVLARGDWPGRVRCGPTWIWPAPSWYRRIAPTPASPVGRRDSSWQPPGGFRRRRSWYWKNARKLGPIRGWACPNGQGGGELVGITYSRGSIRGKNTVCGHVLGFLPVLDRIGRRLGSAPLAVVGMGKMRVGLAGPRLPIPRRRPVTSWYQIFRPAPGPEGQTCGSAVFFPAQCTGGPLWPRKPAPHPTP